MIMSLTVTDKMEMREMMVDVVSTALEEVVVPRFESLEGRMDQIEDKVDSLEGKVDGLDGKVDRLEGKVDGLEGRMDRQEKATNDLRDELRSTASSLHQRFDQLEGKVEAIENDIKDIYVMLAEVPSDNKFAKLSIEKKLLKAHSLIIDAAKQAGVTLPNSSNG
jgi:predicted  nucleic acid-binding Zn-ribbon protein